MTPEFSDRAQQDEPELPPSLGYIRDIADLITQQTLQIEAGRRDLESPSSFQNQINTLITQAVPVLKAAKPLEIKQIKTYLRTLDPSVAARIAADIETALKRKRIPSQRKRGSVP